jgi:VWFA-related protein
MIADQTGRRMFLLDSATDLSAAYRQIADDMRSQYLLAYTPGHNGQSLKWHDISIRLKDRSGIALRTRKGYYAIKTDLHP